MKRGVMAVAAVAAVSMGSGALSAVARSADAGKTWPSFRGVDASGVSDGQALPDKWDVSTGENLRWKAAIPGLAHSSPIVWNDRVFVATAVSSRADATFKPGLYGEGTASDDRSIHKWMVIALDARTGQTIWQQVAHAGVPREKRHIKSTYASATPAIANRTLYVRGQRTLWAIGK